MGSDSCWGSKNSGPVLVLGEERAIIPAGVNLSACLYPFSMKTFSVGLSFCGLM